MKARHLGSTMPTGSFGAFRPPSVVGVSPDVAVATRSLARSAKKAEQMWERRLSETTEDRLRRERRERTRRASARRKTTKRSRRKALPKGV